MVLACLTKFIFWSAVSILFLPACKNGSVRPIARPEDGLQAVSLVATSGSTAAVFSTPGTGRPEATLPDFAHNWSCMSGNFPDNLQVPALDTSQRQLKCYRH